MKRQTSDSRRQPQIARPAALPQTLEFGDTVAVDIRYVHDCLDVRHTLLSIVDHGTTFHIVARIESPSASNIEAAFNTTRLTPYGAPASLSLGLETGLQSGFVRLRERHSVEMKNATQAH